MLHDYSIYNGTLHENSEIRYSPPTQCIQYIPPVRNIPGADVIHARHCTCAATLGSWNCMMVCNDSVSTNLTPLY